MIYWQEIAGTALLSLVGLIAIYFVARTKMNVESKLFLGLRSFVMAVLTSWHVLAPGGAAIIPLPSIIWFFMSFGKAAPQNTGETIFLSYLVIQFAIQFLVFYIVTARAKNVLVK